MGQRGAPVLDGPEDVRRRHRESCREFSEIAGSRVFARRNLGLACQGLPEKRRQGQNARCYATRALNQSGLPLGKILGLLARKVSGTGILIPHEFAKRFDVWTPPS